MSKCFLVTGAAGFIGAALIKRLIKNGERVIGLDNLNNYYEPALKKERLAQINLIKHSNDLWSFHKLSIEDKSSLEQLFKQEKPQVVVNLAAQAGVRYSINNPRTNN